MDFDFGDLDLGDAPAWLALLIAVAAVVVALRANHFAKKSSRAAIDSAEHARRSADAAERQALAAEQAVPLPPPDVDWQIEWVTKDRYRLRNTGTGVARGVKVADHGALLWADPIPPEIGSRAAVEFWVAETAGALAPAELLVSWDGHPAPIAVPLS
jgi:hypothetical protein